MIGPWRSLNLTRTTVECAAPTPDPAHGVSGHPATLRAQPGCPSPPRHLGQGDGHKSNSPISPRSSLPTACAETTPSLPNARSRSDNPSRLVAGFQTFTEQGGLVFGLHLALCIIFGKLPILTNHSRAPFLCLRGITPPLLPQIASRSRGGVMAARIKKPVTIRGHGLYWLRGSDLN